MKRFIAFCFLIFSISCDDDDLGLTSNPIDSKIIIETREVLETNSRRLTFYCQTEKIYHCYNFSILTEEQTEGDSFKITFTSIGMPMLCLTALGPATTLIDLKSVPNGEYEIELNNANLKNKGTLKITDTEISLQFGLKNGIEFV